MNAVAGVLERFGALAPEIVRRADEMERARSVPPAIFDEVVATGCFSMFLPEVYGGLEVSLPEATEVIIEAARIDGSIGWLTMIGTAVPFIFSHFPRATVEEMLDGGTDLRARGSIAPKGVAVPVDGGYVVSGQWPFASGGPDPRYVAGHCVVLEAGAPRIGPSGIPDMVMAIMDASEVAFLDTWHVAGLKATDSKDFAAREVFVPEARTTNVFTARSCFSTPLARLPLRVVLAPTHAALAVGIAQGALDDITVLATTKRAAMNPAARLAEDPVFQHLLGEQALRLGAVRAMLANDAAATWDAALAERPLDPVEVLRVRSMAGYVTAECVKVVDAAYTMAGSTSLYETSSLQRRLRDIHVATQHVAAGPENYRILGALLVGEPVAPMALF